MSNRTTGMATKNRVRFVVQLTVWIVGLTLPHVAFADHVKTPPVPTAISVAAGHEPFLVGHAIGTQNYSCLPGSGGAVGWMLFGPQATLFDKHGRQLITHFLRPNPDEADAARATWQPSEDTSSVWGVAIASSTDAAFVETGAIPWLLLQVVGTRNGPLRREHTLKATTYVHRLNTSGGMAPAAGCS